jgi:ribonuclease VapC
MAVVIDASAVVAILFGEPERMPFVELIEGSPRRLLSAVSALECAMVIEHRRGVAGGNELDIFLHRAQIEIVSVDAEQFAVARQAWRRYGKGRHPARLNFGDCFTYALAKISNEPLLAKGGDFNKTDLQMLE